MYVMSTYECADTEMPNDNAMKIADHNLNESLLTSDYVRRRIKMRYLLLLVAIDDLRSVH